VATPIGNLDDITYRAVAVLRSSSVVACEDTRHSQKLLNYWAITSKRLIALHEYNETKQVAKIKHVLDQGEDVALISDAGTPLINDPGYVLVRDLRLSGYQVTPIPGPCAFITALSASGLPTDKIYFHGFLPSKTSARKRALQQMSDKKATLIFYEAPHRVKSSLYDMLEIFGAERSAAIARELTKRYESGYFGTLSEVLHQLEVCTSNLRGEMVMMVEGAPSTDQTLQSGHMAMLQVLLKELPLSQAVKIAHKITG